MKIKRLNHKYILDRFLKSRKARLILFGTEYHQVKFCKLGGLPNRPTRTSFRLRVMVRTIFGHAQEIAWCFCDGIFRPDTHVVEIGCGYDHGRREPRQASRKTFLRAPVLQYYQ